MRSTLVFAIAIALTSRAARSQPAAAPALPQAPVIAPPGPPFYPPGYVPPPVSAGAPRTPAAAMHPPSAYAPYAYAPPAVRGYYYPRAVYIGDEGSGGRERTATKPAPAARRRAPIQRKDPTMFVAGAVIMVTGTMALVSGIALTAAVAADEPDLLGNQEDQTPEYVACAIAMGGGAAAAGIGSAMMVIGGRRATPAATKSAWVVGPSSIRWRTAF